MHWWRDGHLIFALTCFISFWGLPYLALNTWNTMLFPYLNLTQHISHPVALTSLRCLQPVMRWLAPWHILHGYGVFMSDMDFALGSGADQGHRRQVTFEAWYPNAARTLGGRLEDPTRVYCAAIEPLLPVVYDVVTPRPYWESTYGDVVEFTAPFLPGLVWKGPRLAAPHHPRFDHQLVYEGFLQHPSDTNYSNPYYRSVVSARHGGARGFLAGRTMQRILQGSVEVGNLLCAPQLDELGPPSAVRAVMWE